MENNHVRVGLGRGDFNKLTTREHERSMPSDSQGSFARNGWEGGSLISE